MTAFLYCIKKTTSYACGSREVGTMIWENKTSFVKIKAGNANCTKTKEVESKWMRRVYHIQDVNVSII